MSWNFKVIILLSLATSKSCWIFFCSGTEGFEHLLHQSLDMALWSEHPFQQRLRILLHNVSGLTRFAHPCVAVFKLRLLNVNGSTAFETSSTAVDIEGGDHSNDGNAAFHQEILLPLDTVPLQMSTSGGSETGKWRCQLVS